jgi:hypothetical protein
LCEIGIEDRDKAPMHLFRHRAAQRLRRAIADEALREAIGGWADGKKRPRGNTATSMAGAFRLRCSRKQLTRLACEDGKQ